MATKSWLDLMGEDSNLSIASIASIKSFKSINNNSKSIDPELDNSQQGINLLLKKNINFIISDDSQSRKRTFKQIQTITTDDEKCFLPPKAKQRTNERGQWKKTKYNKKESALDFTRFLNIPNKNEDNNKNEIKKEIKKEIQNILSDDTEDGDTEDDDLDEIILLKKSKRIIPTLPPVVFDRDLILHKVPIICKKEADCSFTELPNVPVYLNADQIDELPSEKQKQIQMQIDEYENKQIDTTKKQLQKQQSEIQPDKRYENEIQPEIECKQEEEEEDCSVWYGANITDNSSDDINENGTGKVTWAVKLFSSEMKQNKLQKQREELNLVNDRKNDRLSEIMLSKILPPVSIVTPSNTTISNTTVTSVATDSEDNDIDVEYKPSNDATIWREKQIKIAKDTVGYKNYIKLYPNKDTLFRLSNNLCLTPGSQERIGKKRWCGKYKKWRKFLHQFDNI